MFDFEEIYRRAEPSSLERGQSLYKKGQVKNLRKKGSSISATVKGQSNYLVMLSQTGQKIINSCTCPAASYQDFCKHCVAAALAANNEADIPEGTPVSAKKTPKKEKTDPDQLVKELLASKPQDELIEIVMGYIREDNTELKKWRLRAELASKPPSPSEIKKMITKALPMRDIWEYRKVRQYFEQAESLFETIGQAISTLPVEEQWKLALHAITRLNKALERIDDSNGDRYGLEYTLSTTLIELFAQLPWEDEQKAQWLLDHIDNKDLDLFPNIPDDFNPSESVYEVFRGKCYQQLEKMATNKPTQKSELFEYRWQIRRYCQPLIDHASKTDNWREHCSLLGLVADSHRDLLTACRICLDHDEPFDAEDWLIKAKKRCNDEKDLKDCALVEVEIRAALDQSTNAWQIAWQLFEEDPSFKNFIDLKAIEQRIGVHDKELNKKVEHLLLKICQPSPRPAFGRYTPAARDDILAFYLYQQQFDQALTWAKKHASASQYLIKLAKAIIKQQPEDGVELYRQAIASEIEQTNNQAYQQAMALLLQLEKQFKQQDIPLNLFAQLVQTLSQTYRNKRNMMALIKEHLSQYL